MGMYFIWLPHSQNQASYMIGAMGFMFIRYFAGAAFLFLDSRP